MDLAGCDKFIHGSVSKSILEGIGKMCGRDVSLRCEGWIHFQLETHQGVEITSRVPHTPISPGVLDSESLHGDADYLGLGIIPHRVARTPHPAPGEAVLALLPLDFAPRLGLDEVPAVLVGALHRQSLPFTTLHFPVQFLTGGT